jgi:RHS repeat-associated protein
LPVVVTGAATVAEESLRPGKRLQSQPAGVSSVRVDVLDRVVAEAAGVSAVVLVLSRADGVAASGRVGLRVDYSRFANAFGADFGNRLRLVGLPACVLTAPSEPSCQTRSELGSVNAGGVVSAEVGLAGDVAGDADPAEVGAAGTVVGLTSGSSSDGATWSATSLSPTYSWTAGGQGGEFGYGYPLRVPPSLGGPAPSLSLAYSSGSVDGQTLAQNGQASWVGEGWDLQVGYVERSYRSCKEDGGSTGDLCWFSPYNATLVWNGRSTPLVRDATTGVWHAGDDDAVKVEQLFGSPNWSSNGEYWRVTTLDGTQYYFGVNKRYAGDTGQTLGAQVVPVYGNGAGEPCHQSTFAGSWCHLGYRWNLDYVVDPRGNSMTYFYGKTVGYVGLNGNTNVQPYDVNGYLDHIDYGTRAGSEASGNAPVQVWFGKAGRCVGGCTAAEYLDTPLDLYCNSSTSCPNLTTPAYFLQWQLSTVTTTVWNAAASAYRAVDRWDLGHTFPPSGDYIAPAGDDSAPNLWLQTITHTGYAADGTTTLAEPTMSFGGSPMVNRVDWGSDLGVAPFTHYRLTSIVNGVGGQTLVGYSAVECFRGWKPVPAFNPLRCFPQYQSIGPLPGFEWFHKYVVIQVTERDLTGGAPDEMSGYTYYSYGTSDASLWHHDINETSGIPLERTSWAQWRGYPTVSTTRGPVGGTQTVTTSLSYRGLDGDAMRGSSLLWGTRRAGLLTPPGTPGVTGAISGLAGRCLDIFGGGTANGTRVQLYDCHGGANQVWQPQLGGMLKNPQSGRCLEAAGAGTTDGTPLQIFDCTGAANQLWWTLPNGSLQNPVSGRCLTAVSWGTANGTPIQLWGCTEDWPQRWNMQAGGSIVNTQASRCIDVAGGATANGTHIQNYSCNGTAAQLWQSQANGSLKNPQSGRCLDITNSGTANGTPIQLYDCTGAPNQTWVPQDNGGLKNPQSGRCLDAGNQPSNGLQLVIWDCTGALTQKWTHRLVDAQGLQGFTREASSLNAGSVATSTIHEPTITQTASRPSAGGGAPDFAARMVRETTTRTRTRLTASNSWRWTQTSTAYDSYGLPTDVTDLGDLATTADDTCTHTSYTTRDTTRWMINYPAQVLTTDCAPTLGDADYLSGTDLYYDNLGWGITPTRGLATKTNALASVVGGVRTWKQAARTDYDTNGRITSSYDALDRRIQMIYTPVSGGPVTQLQTINPLGHVTTTTIDPGRDVPTRVVDPNTRTTEAAYDPLGRLTKVWFPGTPTTATPDQEYGYTLRATGANAITTKRLGPNGNQITSYALYDGRLRPRQAQTPAPQANGGRIITDTGYDARGLTVKASVFWNNTSGPTDTLVAFADTDVARQQRSSYDNLERQTVDALWSRNTLKWQTSVGYDGDRTMVTPPAGGIATTTITNARGKTVELRQYLTGTPSGAYQATTYSYDRLSRVTRLADPAGNTWTTSYDLRGRITRTVDPDKGAITLTYDDAGQLLTTTDARTTTLSRTYDALGRQTALWQGAAGTGTKLTDAVYDSLVKGQLTSSTRYVSGNAYTTAITGYDDRYRPLGGAVTIPTVEGSLAGTWTSTTSYNVDGSPATTTYPAAAGLAAETVTFTYDNTGAPLTAIGQDSYISGTTYYPWGDVNQRILGSGTKRVRVTATIDEATRRLTTNQTHTEDQTTPGSWVERLTETYGYDPAGNIKNIAETSAGTTVSNQCFSYDPLRRLLEAWTTTATACQTAPSQAVVGGSDPYWTSYRYDTVGNRTLDVSHAPTGDTTRSYTYPAAGAAQPHTLQSVTATGASTGTNSYSYDPAGNTTTRNLAGQPGQTLTWDPEGHLNTVTTSAGVTSYLYDAAGNRLIGKDANGATLYLGHTEIRRDPLGSATATRYCPGGAVRTSTGGLVFQTGDHHGTTQLSIKASDLSVARRKSDPFGNPRGPQPAWPTTRGYVGGTTDPTGLTHLGAREYDPTTGRFISLDSVFDLADPHSWQGYAYANNSPVTSSDASGLRVDDAGPACGTPGGAPCNSLPTPPSQCFSVYQPGCGKYDNDGGRGGGGSSGGSNKGNKDGAEDAASRGGPACALNKCTTVLLNGSVYTVIDAGPAGIFYFVNGISIDPMDVQDPLQFAALYDYYLPQQTGDDPLIRMLAAMSLACETHGAPAGCSASYAAGLNAEIAFYATLKSGCDERCQEFNLHLMTIGVAGGGALAGRFPGAGGWTIKGRMRAAGPGYEYGLPSQGRIRYVPPEGYNPASPLPRGPNGGYIDRFGNEWVVGPSRTPGQPFEWDVQLSSTGQEQIGWLSRDGAHVNVSPLGEVTHR